MTTPQSYAFFDFDGTLIARDSFLLMLKFHFKQQPWRLVLAFLLCPLLLVCVSLRGVKTGVKSFLLWILTVGKSKKAALHCLTSAIVAEQGLWFREVLKTWEDLRQQGVSIVVVSASGATWIHACLRAYNTGPVRAVIGSRLAFYWGGVVLTGKNCYGEEKIDRIYKTLGSSFVWHSSWTDHVADLPLLKKAPKRYVICPKPAHLPTFQTELGDTYELLQWTV